jgi:hypothetical protein
MSEAADGNLDFGLDHVDGVGRLHLKGDGLSRELPNPHTVRSLWVNHFSRRRQRPWRNSDNPGPTMLCRNQLHQTVLLLTKQPATCACHLGVNMEQIRTR